MDRYRHGRSFWPRQLAQDEALRAGSLLPAPGAGFGERPVQLGDLGRVRGSSPLELRRLHREQRVAVRLDREALDEVVVDQRAEEGRHDRPGERLDVDTAQVLGCQLLRLRSAYVDPELRRVDPRQIRGGVGHGGTSCLEVGAEHIDDGGRYARRPGGIDQDRQIRRRRRSQRARQRRHEHVAAVAQGQLSLRPEVLELTRLPIFTGTVIFTTIVNKSHLMNIEGPLEKDVLRILQEIPGVTAEPTTGKRRQDIVVRAGDVTHVVEVKAQRTTNAAAARQLVEYARHLPKGAHLLLVAQTTTEEARQLLEEAGVGVIDTQGNMRIELPGLFLWTEGRHGAAQPREKADQPPVKLMGKAGVAAQALLEDTERQWKVRDLAEVADVSVGLAHRLFTRLEREHLVEATRAGPQRTRHLTNPAALLDLWAEEMRDRGVKQARAYRLARDPRMQARTLSQHLAKANIEHAVTGPAGAARLAPFITAIPVTDVWVTETVALDEVLAAVGAEPVADGHNIVVRRAVGDTPLAFRRKLDDVWTANSFRLFFDLRNDPRRGREQAERLREEVIGF
jgi:hypothetical protein